jgi:hypothetical protein
MPAGPQCAHAHEAKLGGRSTEQTGGEIATDTTHDCCVAEVCEKSQVLSVPPFSKLEFAPTTGRNGSTRCMCYQFHSRLKILQCAQSSSALSPIPIQFKEARSNSDGCHKLRSTSKSTVRSSRSFNNTVAPFVQQYSSSCSFNNTLALSNTFSLFALSYITNYVCICICSLS